MTEKSYKGTFQVTESLTLLSTKYFLNDVNFLFENSSKQLQISFSLIQNVWL